MRRLLLAASLFSVLSVVASCEAAPPEIKTDFPNPPEVPAGGIELSMPEIVIEPGQDVTWCFVPEFAVDEDFVVKRALSYQGVSGHHMAIYRSGVPRQAGELFDCTNLETMVSMLPLVIPDVADNPTRIMPDGFGVRVPAGSAIVIQAHLINATPEPVKVKDVMQLELAAAGEALTEASYWVISDNELVLPEGPSTVTKSCTIVEETKLVFQLGHMHEWGTSMNVTRHRPDGEGGETVETIYEVEAWSAEYRDQGPTTSYPADAPLVLAPGDRIDLTCSWDNDTGADIRWPKEMCVTLGAYFPARGGGFLDCDEAIGE